MRERSHKKGEVYQQDVKHWLLRSGFLGLEAEAFGDAYDVTKKACLIGGVAFDFSLKLRRGGMVRRILYGECKFRHERRGKVDTEFLEFLKRVGQALGRADADDAETAVFVFLSSVPPRAWGDFLRNRARFLHELFAAEAEPPPAEVVAGLAGCVHILVLSPAIVERIP